MSATSATGSDAEVIAASLDEPEVFGEIFDRHADPLLRFFVRRIGPEEAGGLVGELFRIAFERRASFDTAHANARPWLYGIGSNLLRSHRRSQARRLRAVSLLASGFDAARVEKPFDAHLVLPKLAEAIDALPEGERAALLLFALEELGYREVAIALEIPVGTVRSRINRARKRLHAVISREDAP